MQHSEPTVVHDPGKSRFEIRQDGAVVGFADYQRNGSTVSLTHTVVDPAFEGRGLGSALARTALDAARDQGDTVLPFCDFIRSYVEQHPEYLDLVPAGQRTRFGLAPGDPESGHT